MLWLHSTRKKTTAVNRASTLEFLASFEDDHENLLRLALLITGDIDAAERSVRTAHEMATHGAYPFSFRQLAAWVKWVTIKSAIASTLDEIAPYEPKYVNRNCTHSEHLLNGNDSKLQIFCNFLCATDPEIVIAELDPLARAVAILRTIARASILDCTLPLSMSADAVLAANCRVMTWIAEKRNRAHADTAPSRLEKL
jgi:hypothetical protein